MTGVSRRNALFGLSASGLAVATGLSIVGTGFAGGVKEVHQLKPGEFAWHPERSPEGPVAIVVSLPDQLVHVYMKCCPDSRINLLNGEEGAQHSDRSLYDSRKRQASSVVNLQQRSDA